MPITTGPSGTNASTTNPRRTRPTFRLDQEAWLRTLVVAMETLLLVQAHRAQGGSYGPLSWSEDRTDEQHLGVLPDAF